MANMHRQSNSHQLLPASSDMPLQCTICPKQPNFSDVSHLLTHVGSKGHLVNFYKIQVKAANDVASSRVLADYQDWYEEWNLQGMMSERYDQKDKKKSSAASNSGSTSRRGSGTNSAASSRSSQLASVVAGRRSQAFRESTLDPQLGLVRIKEEPKSRSTTPASGYTLEAALLNRSYAPPMQGWPETPYRPTPTDCERSMLGSIPTTPSSDSDESIEADLPARYAGRKRQRKPSKSTVADEDGELEDGLNDSTRLKGIIWPGMDLFDSATLEMRRKRNQKKATSVVEQLQATSEVVEATELIFDGEGSLIRERPITGNPEEHDGRSPLPGELTPEPENPPEPKKRVGRRPRAALTKRNVNTGREPRNKRNQRQTKTTRGSNTRRSSKYDDPDEDDDLTFGGPLPRKRAGLSIHRDNSGPEITFDRPAPFSTLTSGFRNPFPMTATAHGSHPSYGLPNRGHRQQHSFSYGQGFRATQNNPLVAPLPNFGSFGGLSGQSMFQNPNFHGNSFPFPNSHHVLAAFQQQFNPAPQHFGNDSSSFHMQESSQSQYAWDMLGGSSAADLDLANPADVNFPVAGEYGAMSNPLFQISSNHVGPEDDEATVSPPSQT